MPSPFQESDEYGEIGVVPIIGEIETVPNSLESILDEMEILGIVVTVKTRRHWNMDTEKKKTDGDLRPQSLGPQRVSDFNGRFLILIVIDQC